MADNLTAEQRKKNMQNIKSKDTKIELALRKALWSKGYRYRKNYQKLPGKPDIVLTKYKIVIFCDSEFFHGKDWEVLKPRLQKAKNSDYWIKKISRNKERDIEIEKQLLFEGWTVIRFWGSGGIKMGHYNNATICLNGHVVSKYQANYQKFCSKCGKETYSKCPECNSPIHGKYEVDGIVDLSGSYNRPDYCYNCGAPYPWTKIILDNAVMLVSLEDELDESMKELIKTAIPDLITETPATPIAIAKYKKGIKCAGDILKNSMRQLLIDVVSETVKKSLFQ